MKHYAEIETINVVLDRIDDVVFRVPSEETCSPEENGEWLVESLYGIVNERHGHLARAYLTLPDGAGRFADFVGQIGIRWFALAESRCPSRTPRLKADKLRNESINGIVNWLIPNYHYLLALNTHLIGIELANPSGLTNSLYFDLRLIIWGGTAFPRIQDKMCFFFKELIDAHDRGQDRVSDEWLRERLVFAEGKGIDDVFRMERKYGSRNSYDPSRKLVDESNPGFFSMINPKSV